MDALKNNESIQTWIDRNKFSGETVEALWELNRSWNLHAKVVIIGALVIGVISGVVMGRIL